MKLPIIVLFTLAATPLFAQQDIQLLDGSMLKNAKIIRKSEDTIVFSHSTGIATVDAHNLPDDLISAYFPNLKMKQAAAPVETAPKIYRFRELSETQRNDVIEDLTRRYLIVQDFGLLEIFTASGSRSLKSLELGFRYIDDYVSQTLGGDEYFIYDNSVKITIPGNDQLVDGSPVVGLAREDGNYEYITVLGAPRRIRAYTMVAAKRPQIEDFIEALKTNQIFQAKMLADVKCRDCSGKGFTMRATTVSAGYVACPYCGGRGSIEQREREERDPSKIYFGEGSTYKITFVPCDSCRGTGKQSAQAIQQVKTPCKKCDSKGTVKEKIIVDVGW